MAFRTYGNIQRQAGGKQWLMTSLEPHVAIRLKHLFPHIPKGQVDDFLFPGDPQTCADLDWFASRYPLRISPGDMRALRAGRRAFESTQAELEQILTPAYCPPSYIGLRPGEEIRPYQSQAIEIVRRRGSLLLGDGVGLGKTYTAAGLFLLSPARPAAVVVQTHLQGQWEEKLAAFTTLRTHKIKGTKPYDLPDADVYIFKYSQLLGWADFFQTKFFKSVAWDEIQELRTGEDSGKGQAAYVLAQSVDFRLGLSATPIYGYGVEIWNVLRYVDHDVLGDRADFLRGWTDGDKCVKDTDALGTYLREQHVFLRRTKRDVGQQMPPVNKLVKVVEMDHKALDDIADLAQKLAMKVTTGRFVERGTAGRELDLLARHATGVGKARAVAAYARIFLEADIPIMLMGWHRDVYDIWLKELEEFNPVMYTGSESPKQKETSKQAFLEGRSKCFIMSLRSGAGVDGLQAVCSTVLFGELDWSSKLHDQIIGRLDREGQTEQITALFLNSDDGSDPPMVEVLGLKASQSAGIIDPGQLFEPSHSDDTRVKALARQFLGVRALQQLERHAARQEQLDLAA